MAIYWFFRVFSLLLHNRHGWALTGSQFLGDLVIATISVAMVYRVCASAFLLKISSNRTLQQHVLVLVH